MTDSHMDAPERIWVQWPQINGTGLAFTCQARPPSLRQEYILATSTVLAADPAVKALIAAERERCAGECDRTAREADMFGDKHGRQISERTAAAIRETKP